MHKLCAIDKSSEENKTEENKGELKTWLKAKDSYQRETIPDKFVFFSQLVRQKKKKKKGNRVS